MLQFLISDKRLSTLRLVRALFETVTRAPSLENDVTPIDVARCSIVRITLELGNHLSAGDHVVARLWERYQFSWDYGIIIIIFITKSLAAGGSKRQAS